ncbi:NAD(P)-binding protein [Aspergillus steynii IBT 23096]|uniref:NAD(P)-binding protein n=1 Tax=Aspergillus steynii IBT 23096 TaxID=1392250 RepID=A0A2I2FWY4_9EURO|nr:NAD(P)-binding protein [Aspergillus steynii IBT 23096]PLB45076.1 NAD(P)-binding protein [Aspergillus steynii IBT 23096]
MTFSAPFNNSRLAGKNILIIGGTSGIGFAVAKAAIAASANVTVVSSSPSRVTGAVEQLLDTNFTETVRHYGTIAGATCDLSQPTVESDLETLFANLPPSFLPLHHIVYTAANPPATYPVSEITRDRILAAGQLRLVAPILTAKVGSRYLAPGPESSITLTTGAGFERPYPDWTVMAGYLGGMVSVARNLALDLKPVRVNAVSPGVVDTEMWDSLPAEQKQGMFELFQGRFPTGRIARPEDVAEAYVYLMRDWNATGRVLGTDSGASLV